jgi:hypothetical protein
MNVRHLCQATAAATLLALLTSGCGGGSGSPLTSAGNALLAASATTGSGTGGRSALLVGGAPAGSLFEELKSQYQVTAAGAGSDPAKYDALIINGAAFPGQALKTDPLVQKAVALNRELVLVNVTGEQKTAALQGRAVTWTSSASDAYDVQFTTDDNGKPGTRQVDMPVCQLMSGPVRPLKGTRAALTTTPSPVQGGPPDRAGAQLFVQAMRGQLPENMPGVRTRNAGNTYGSIPVGAQYSLNTIITVGYRVQPAWSSNGFSAPAQPLYVYGTHEVQAFRTQGKQGAGFQAILFTDGFVNCYPPTLRDLDVNQNDNQNDNTAYYDWSWYTVAASNDVTVTTSVPLPPNSVVVTATPNAPTGSAASITDSQEFSFGSGGVSVGFSSSQTRTLTDWGFTPVNQTGLHAGFQYGQQVPYNWQQAPNTDSGFPNFALAGFAFHTTTSVATNATYNGTLTLNGSLAGTFHAYLAFTMPGGSNVATLTQPYAVTINWAAIPTGAASGKSVAASARTVAAGGVQAKTPQGGAR